MNTQLLEQPFSAQEIKQREGSFGKMLDYLEGATVINRLNQALDHQWSADVVSHEIVGEEIIVLVRITTEGIVKSQFGSAKIKKNKQTGQPISIGEDYKAATTDAIKKASTLLRVGLHLYMNEAQVNQPVNSTNRFPQPLNTPPAHATQSQQPPQQEQPPQQPVYGANVKHFPAQAPPATDTNAPARATNKQLNYLLFLAKSNMGWNNKTVEQEALSRFGVQFSNLSSRDASSFIEELKVAVAVGH